MSDVIMNEAALTLMRELRQSHECLAAENIVLCGENRILREAAEYAAEQLKVIHPRNENELKALFNACCALEKVVK